MVEDNVLVNGGTMFAVIMKWSNPTLSIEEAAKQGELNNHRNWAPVYCDANGNYHLIDVPLSASEEEYNQAIVTAISNSQYEFVRGNSGYYEVLIDKMPGDILHYLHSSSEDLSNRSNVQYTIFYGWTSASDLKPASLTAAGVEFARLNSDGFTRSFSASFKVVNTKDELNVLKVDENNVGLEGAVFTLYRAHMDDATKVVTIDPANPQIGTTDEDGKLTFASLAAGWHILKETAAPAGYEPSTEQIPIWVQTDGPLSGVYAYAGEEGDGVLVQRGVGKLVGTMHEFGVNDDLDRTLHNITVTPQLWQASTKQWLNAANAYHLHHAHVGEQDGYVPMENGVSAVYTSDVGWPHLLIQQCQHDAPVNSTAYWEPLGDRSITNLFTRDVTVVLTNQKYRDELSIEGKKLLEGRAAMPGEFAFQITAVSPANAPMPALTTVYNAVNGGFQFGPIPFAFDQTGPFVYRVEEIKGTDPSITYDDSYWLVTVTVETPTNDPSLVTATAEYVHYDADGKKLGADEAITFTNVWHSAHIAPPTGDQTQPQLWLMLMLLSMSCMVVLAVKHQKRHG